MDLATILSTLSTTHGWLSDLFSPIMGESLSNKYRSRENSKEYIALTCHFSFPPECQMTRRTHSQCPVLAHQSPCIGTSKPLYYEVGSFSTLVQSSKVSGLPRRLASPAYEQGGSNFTSMSLCWVHPFEIFLLSCSQF